MPEKHRGEFGFGDVWTWTALDPDSKLVVSWLVGQRSDADGMAFLQDLASRLAGRVQLTTDGNTIYPDAVGIVFGDNVDFAQLVKDYGVVQSQDASPTARRYSPNKVISQHIRHVSGNPDPDLISTSYVERHNLSMRMGMRRFTRLTNGFSKKVENHAAAIALYTMWQNFGRPHKSLSNPYPRTPAMAAGIADHIWTCEEIAALLD